MTEGQPLDLKLVGKSEDGTQLELSDGQGNSYSLNIDSDLMSAITAPRLAAVTNFEEKPHYSVKEIQNRLRSGESMDAISRTTDWSVEKIEKFAGPILQERAYIIEHALKSTIRREQNSPTLGEITNQQLLEHGANLEEVEWNTFRNIDGSWNLIIQYPTRNGVESANWNFDPTSLSIEPLDDAASWLIGGNKIERPKLPSNGFITSGETSLPPRLVAVKEEVHLREVVISQDNEGEEFIEELDLDISDESDSKSDGVSNRPKLPSWDDIMFGSNKPTEE